MKKELPFETLMAYADGRLDAVEVAAIEAALRDDPTAPELVAGLKAIYENEGLGASSLQHSFEVLENRIERKIQLHANFSNHLTDLNQQLRAAAAVLLLIFSCSFLTGPAIAQPGQIGVTVHHGPYDLALGSKVAP